MQRLGTALVAFLALVALAGAAGTFDAVEGPSITGDETPAGQPTLTEVPPPTGAPAGSDESSVQRAPTETRAAASGSGGGVSPLFVPAVVGSLFASGLFVVFLTGDDERAPEAPPGDDSTDENPVPNVDPDYGSPAESALVDAWRRLRGRAGADETATPGEVAARAIDRDLPADRVSTVTDRFRAFRYGDERPTDGVVADVESAADRMDETTRRGDDDARESGSTDGR
ncbi:DUF4129 domain-containing protein [Halosimplex aquaticum]|uniref:DUF4129 domain-containing protein n=1 Tax=Halosimplex aquaticum TaxID=3026162 RepID=A0ABD5Y7X4_9EURY|nr:DUF4129 domain-containing protein [Halosimplex aquaticum]